MIPSIQWLRSYEKGWLRPDLIAGFTLAAYLLPSAIGDASLAGLPAEAGIYAVLFGGLIFWIFCSSRQTAVSVTSAISLLVGSSLGALAGGDPSRFGALAACTALVVAAMGLLAWIVRAGSIVNFISETVLVGFKAGVALHLTSTQLPKLFGIKGGHGDFWERMKEFFTHLGETNPTALMVGAGALVVLIVGKMYWKNRPVALFVVIGAIALSLWLNLEASGVKVIGSVPKGLPGVGLPAVHWAEVSELVPLAIACFLLGAVETAAIGRMFAAKNGYRFDSNQEFLALAGANLAAGLGRGFPISGGMSQSLVNESGGARTPLSGLFSAGFILLVCVFLTGMLESLPQPVLAAIVLVAVAGLFNISVLRHFWRFDRIEFSIAMGALLGVLTFGLLKGVLIGALISLVQLLRRASRPRVSILGRIPGTQRFSDAERNPDNEAVPGFFIFRVEASLFYFNIDYVRDTVIERVRAEVVPPRVVVCDMSSSPHIDMQSAHVVAGMARELAGLGIRLEVVETRSSVRDTLRNEGLGETLGEINRHRTVIEVVEDPKHQERNSN